MEFSNVANLNNNGIEAEKKGDIDLAIRLYEENIKSKYPAQHSYSRLIILYRKARKYSDEHRVINEAINVYVEENKKRLSSALSKLENQPYKKQLFESVSSGLVVRNKEGRVILNPYPVIQLLKRKQKLMRIINAKI